MKQKSPPRRVNKKAIVVGVILAVIIIGGSAIAFLPVLQNNPKPSTQSNEFNDIFKKLRR